jgi:signal transduction histidine kinase
MSETLDGILRRWPGRWAYPALLDAIELGGADLERAVLEDQGRSGDAPTALAELIARRRFDLADAFLDSLHPCPPELRRQNEEARAAVRIDVERQLARLEHRAEQAGVPMAHLDERDRELLDDGRADQVVDLVDEIDAEVEERIEAESQALLVLLDDRMAGLGDDGQSIARELRLLIEDGELRQAATAIQQVDAAILGEGPVFRPSREAAPPTTDPMALVNKIVAGESLPLGISRSVTPAGRDLLAALADIDAGVDNAANRFASAFAHLFGRSPLLAQPDRTGAWLVTNCQAVSQDSEAARFQFTPGEVQLWIPRAGGPLPVEPVDGLWVTISLMPRDRDAPRSRLAVLDPHDLIHLATNPGVESLVLLRLVGRQWPIERFVPSPSTGFDALLGDDPRARFLSLWWLLDITGLGRFRDASKLAFESGMMARVLGRLVRRLAALEPRAREDFLARPLEDELVASKLIDECSLLAAEDPSVRDRAALCAVVVHDRFGEWVPIQAMADEIVRLRVSDRDQQATADEVALGVADLAAANVLEVNDADEFRLPASGVAYLLRPTLVLALDDRLRILGEQSNRPRADVERTLDWYAQKLVEHDLEKWEANREKAVETGDHRWVAELDRNRPGPPGEHIRNPGGYEPAAALLKIKADLAREEPSLAVAIEPMDLPELLLPRAVFHLTFTELARNAIRANASGCEVWIAAQVEETHVELWVADNGRGIDAEIVDAIFRSGFSRTDGTGRGLELIRGYVRAVGGELVLESPRNQEVHYCGATFRLQVPRVGAS